MSPRERTSIEVHLSADDLQAALEEDARTGLRAVPKELPPKYFYDERGCELFEAITRLPEYYPTRAERSILVAHADEIATTARADTLVELGSGTSAKTRLLLDAGLLAGRLRRFVPFDVSEPTLRAATRTVASEYPALEVHAVVGDFERHLAFLPDGDPRMVAFLGGTIGNLAPPARARFFETLAAQMAAGDSLLLGTDLVKPRTRLLPAYDDDAGVTAEFNRNVLRVLNRDLGADFEPAAFDHIVAWDAAAEWVEMRLRATSAQSVKVPAIDLVVEFADGEEMRTEISTKFRRARVQAELAAADLELRNWWTDAAGEFALSLAVRR